jgi:hypothetical protein
VAVRTVARERSVGREVTGSDRLALLYLWYRDGHPPQLGSVEVAVYSARGAQLASTRGVDWSGFPWADAVTAVASLNTRRRIATPLAFKARG